jgi:tetratricopeptide (TPR) repeat protein
MFSNKASYSVFWFLIGFTCCAAMLAGWFVLRNEIASKESVQNRNDEQIVGGSFRNIVYQLYDGIRFRDHSSRQRILIWKDTLLMLSEHPLLGVGVGNFEYALPMYSSRESLEMKGWMEERQGTQLMANSAHNEYLEICAEVGFFGFSVFGYFLFQVASVIFVLLNRYIKGGEGLLFVGLSVAIIATLSHAFFSTNLQDPASAISFWIVIGIAWSLNSNVEKLPRKDLLKVRTNRSILIVLTISIIAIFITVSMTYQSFLGGYYFQRGRLFFETQNDYQKAGDELELAANFYPPRSFAVYQALGLARYNQKRWGDAILAFRKSLEYHPNNDVVYLYLGMAWAQRSNYSEAVKYLHQAVELNKWSQKSRFEFGKVLGASGDIPAAIDELQIAIAIKPAAEIYNELGGNHRRVGNLDTAVDNYLKGLALGPEDPELWNSLGVVYVEQGRFEAACEVFKNLLADWPNRIDYRMNFIVALASIGDQPEALNQCRTILKVAPDNVKARALMEIVGRN